MESKVTHSLVESMRLQLKFYQTAIIGLILVLAILMPILYWGLKHQKTIVVPAMIKSPIAFSDVSVDASGLQQMALNLIYARYNVTPQTVDANYGYLLTFADSKIYPDLKALLATEASAIKKQKLTASFYVGSVKVDAANLSIKVTGTLQEYSGILGVTNNKMPDQHKVFILTMQYNAGQLLLKSWDEDKKDES